MGLVCPFISRSIQAIEDGQWTRSALFPVECPKERCVAWGVIGGPIQRSGPWVQADRTKNREYEPVKQRCRRP